MTYLIVQIPFVFANPEQNITPLGADPARLELGNVAARMWTSFVTDLNPNGHGGTFLSWLEGGKADRHSIANPAMAQVYARKEGVELCLPVAQEWKLCREG
jgi:hypothetical protein